MLSRRKFLRLFARLGLIGIAFASYAFVFEPLRWPRIKRYTVRPRNWPRGLSLKIAAVADIHACEPWMTAGRIRSGPAPQNLHVPEYTFTSDTVVTVG